MDTLSFLIAVLECNIDSSKYFYFKEGCYGSPGVDWPIQMWKCLTTFVVQRPIVEYIVEYEE